MKSLVRKTAYTLLLSFGSLLMAQAQNFPHIIANEKDKEAILYKIKNSTSTDSLFKNMEKELYPYVMKYQMTIEYDPAWLMSRYQMNWGRGEFFTDCQVDESGKNIIELSGDASYPTIKYGEYGIPTDEKGYEYRVPELDELMPYNTDSTMLLQHPVTMEYAEVAPQSYTALINQKINEIALKSAILYWLTEKEEYGYLAADLLNLWAQGLSNQNAVVSEKNTSGLLNLDPSQDIAYRDLILAYDFAHDFMEEHSYNMTYYQPVFERFAESLIKNGSIADNTSAMESATLVVAALSLEDKAKRDYYMQFFLDKDSVDNRKGHLSLATLTRNWIGNKGEWKEPARYQNQVLPQLLLATYVAEKNGYPVLAKYPALLNTYSEMLSNSFPNMLLPNFGDTDREKLNPQIIEFSLALNRLAHKDTTSSLDALSYLAQKGIYAKENGDHWTLLLDVPEIKEDPVPMNWKRMGEVDYARNYFVRSGMDPEKDFMVTMQGGTFHHNHADGLSMELFGRGTMLGVDPGTLNDLEHPIHVDYYSQWAAHNTVVPAGSASPDKLFKGGDQAKNIGSMTKTAMGSGERSGFITGKYTERYTKTNQERTVGYVKSSDSTGYYVDIFRSNNRLMNDYIYHNIGDSATLLDHSRNPLNLYKSAPFTVEPDFPGIRFFKNSKSTGKRNEGVISLFKLKDKQGSPLNMQAFFVSSTPKEYYIGQTPRTMTAYAPYDSKPTPTVFVRQEGEAWTKPFAVVFEPFRPAEGYCVEKAEWERETEKNRMAALKVTLCNGQEQIVLQSAEPFASFRHNGWTFAGAFGIIFKKDGKVTGLEMASGKTIGIGDYLVTAKTASATYSLTFTENGFTVNTDETLEVKYNPYRSKSKKRPVLETSGAKKALLMKRKSKDTFIIPANSNGTVVL